MVALEDRVDERAVDRPAVGFRELGQENVGRELFSLYINFAIARQN
jgi:hypothetical protein